MADYQKAKTTLPLNSFKSEINGTPWSIYEGPTDIKKTAENYFFGNEITISLPSVASGASVYVQIPSSTRFIEDICLNFVCTYSGTATNYYSYVKNVNYFMSHCLIDEINYKAGGGEQRKISGATSLIRVIDPMDKMEDVQEYVMQTGMPFGDPGKQSSEGTNPTFFSNTSYQFTNMGQMSDGTNFVKTDVYKMKIPLSFLPQYNPKKNFFPYPNHLTQQGIELVFKFNKYNQTNIGLTSGYLTILYGNVSPDNQLMNVSHHIHKLEWTTYTFTHDGVSTTYPCLDGVGADYASRTTPTYPNGYARYLTLSGLKNGETMELQFMVQRAITSNEGTSTNVEFDLSQNRKSLFNGNLIVTDIELKFAGQTIWYSPHRMNEYYEGIFGTKPCKVKKPYNLSIESSATVSALDKDKKKKQPVKKDDEDIIMGDNAVTKVISFIENGLSDSIIATGVSSTDLKTWTEDPLFRYYRIPLSRTTNNIGNPGDYSNGVDFKNTTLNFKFSVWAYDLDVDAAPGGSALGDNAYSNYNSKKLDTKYRAGLRAYTGPIKLWLDQGLYTIDVLDGTKATTVN